MARLRGFTIDSVDALLEDSVGPPKARSRSAADFARLLADAEDTLSASSAHRDFSLSKVSLQELAELNGKMVDRFRRGAERPRPRANENNNNNNNNDNNNKNNNNSNSNSNNSNNNSNNSSKLDLGCGTVTDDDLELCWEKWASSFTRGLESLQSQLPGDERTTTTTTTATSPTAALSLSLSLSLSPTTAKQLAATTSPTKTKATRTTASDLQTEGVKQPEVKASCAKGGKAHLEPTPNQDNFSIVHFKNGYSLACCMDGHGPDGHVVATRTVQTLPFFLVNSLLFPYNVAGALKEAFERAQQDVVAWSLERRTDIQASGTTAVAVVWRGARVWVANVGDSRCVISSLSRKLVFASADHKPDLASERARVEASGGEVRSKVCGPDGWTVHRIFVQGQDYPGLAMSRSLGDQSVKHLGVIATPEIYELDVDLAEQPFVLLASDGIWEFIMSENVVNAVGRRLQRDGAASAVQWLQEEARRQWKLEEGQYCDDITAVLIPLTARPTPSKRSSCCCRRKA